MRAPGTHQTRSEQGYHLLFFYANSAWVKCSAVGFLLFGGGVVFYLLWQRLSEDASPDSVAGYILAFAGMGFLLLAAFRYSMVRRARKRAIGQLNASLNWHMCFGLVGLALLFLHSFGNFNPRSGTYALYGMIAMVISGSVGKILDRILPRLITQEVHQTLTSSGEDKVERISRKLQAVSEQKKGSSKLQLSLAGILYGRDQSQPGLAGTQRRDASMVGLSIPPSWDLAYISLEETPQELKQREITLATNPTSGNETQKQMLEIKNVQHSLHKEQFYRYTLRYWRLIHKLLALVTLGLTIWHLVYALQLLIPVWLKH
ncbi:hypothetical protein [Ktedonospora formicarum]|uniref:Iron reductase n=1 Tax=Ktedonospora formicarum TaxID=2778364 RepID=A0A8J3HUW1_9CHLR|nr:hypothetical protein [Ktedonospora formicarum]GHO44204.1 hypothetical protein KSX_23670 [Ktedonospora formicarum]